MVRWPDRPLYIQKCPWARQGNPKLSLMALSASYEWCAMENEALYEYVFERVNVTCTGKHCKWLAKLENRDINTDHLLYYQT